MASPRAVAVRRQIADQRLAAAAESASRTFGVPFTPSRTSPKRYPQLAAAEMTENVAEFLEKITAAPVAAQRKEKSR